jgi:hypothetical protein
MAAALLEWQTGPIQGYLAEHLHLGTILGTHRESEGHLIISLDEAGHHLRSNKLKTDDGEISCSNRIVEQ